jgi:hypothetical protein
VDTGPALPLSTTYSHLPLPNGFDYRFIDDCVIDPNIFGTEDPRCVSGVDPEVCQICKEKQSDDVISNHCTCFPGLFGGIRYPPPVQLYSTASGKNNGVIARCVCCVFLLLPFQKMTLTLRRNSKEAQLSPSSSVLSRTELTVWM